LQFGPSNATAATAAFVENRVGSFEAYGSSTIAVWVINPGTKESPTAADMERTWAPFIPAFKKFLSSPAAQ
jgi:hypothetical protein